MRYSGVIQRKLALLDQQILRIEESLRDVSYVQFEGSWVLRSMAERLTMRGIGHRQLTVQKIKMMKKMQRPWHKGGKRVPLSRRDDRRGRRP